MKNKKKVIIIAPSILPIPAIESGAYEQLIDSLINLNEIHSKFEFIVISLKHSGTLAIRKNFKNTSFIDFKITLVRRFFSKLEKILFRLTNKKKWYNHIITDIRNIILKSDFDKVLIVGNVNYIKPVSEIVDKSKLVFYLCTEILTNTDDFSLCGKVILGNKRLVALLNQMNKNLNYNQTINLTPGIDIDYFRRINISKVQKLKNEYNLNSNTIIICYVGRIVISKGVGILLQAALELSEIENFKILLIGSIGSNFGSKKRPQNSIETDGIEEMIKDLGSKCISTGFVANDDLPDYLALADIGVVPSLCEDVAPSSYLQFQAIGKPTIVSDGGGIPEFFSQEHSIMVSRGENMIEELKNAIVELILNKNKRNELGKNARLNSEYLRKERYFQDFSTIILNNQ